ncbi:permease [Aliiruegeria sabulilitoris]|uniref:permease n=1 Tax=Aliiruegeria sabulilitoris TaxID=1510458 RepID=UPI0008366B60|nr:permease [Aliiruegeria sabulilitoris]NDR59423.1 permease [Pseudoruegeria sp. M32A2M]
MSDTTQTPPRLPTFWRRTDKVWLFIAAIPLAVALFDTPQTFPTIEFALGALGHTAPFIIFAVLAVALLKATGAENLLARAFEGREVRMIFLAAVAGGLSPFCSCEVIPFIAAMLALGAPLSAVMAFWLSSPLMDPAMFLITSGTLGWEFALAKTVAAIGLGLLGGFGVRLFANTPVFADPLRKKPQTGCGSSCGCGKPFSGKPVWKFWPDPERRTAFWASIRENGPFLFKWLLLAYLLEALMLEYVPAEAIAQLLGGEGIRPVLLGAIVGAPAYLNGYAAVPLIDALLQQGMANGAAMSFALAGGISCVPAAVAVWALVKPRVFAGYLGFAMIGALLAGLSWGAIA